MLISQIGVLDKTEDGAKMERIKLKTKFDGILLAEEVNWKQWSRCNWLREGDENTKFFHSMTKVRKRGNEISSIMIEGDLITDRNAIENYIICHFKNQFRESVNCPEIEGLLFRRISSVQLEKPTMQFDEDEILMALIDCEDDKAPALGVFPMGVLKKTWKFIKDNFVQLTWDFHIYGCMNWRMNTTMLALISKKKDASWVNNYRPISLVNNYKLLFKILANRLKQCHSAFIKGRHSR